MNAPTIPVDPRPVALRRVLGAAGFSRSWSVGIVLVLSGGGVACRGDTEPSPTPTIDESRDHSTGVGNPGNMTVRTGPIDGLRLTTGVWPLDSVVLGLCDGRSLEATVASGAVSVDGYSQVSLPVLTDDERAVGVCSLSLQPAGPLSVGGTSTGIDATFSGDLELEPVEIPFDSVLDVDDTTVLALTLGSEGWLDADWLGLEPGGHVHVDADHPQHDLIARLLAWTTLADSASEATVGSSEGAELLPSMHVAVGYGGWIVGSYSDGRTWTELRPAVDDAEADLFAAAVAGDGSRLVAVGGDTEGVVVVSEDGIGFTERILPTLGLRDVVWSGSRFVAVGLEGRVATSSDGLEWSALAPLGDCHFAAVAESAGTLLAVGAQTTGAGCVWASDDDGESFEPRAGLPSAGFDVHATDGGFVAIGAAGKLSWTLDGGGAWSSVVLADPFLHDVVVWEGWVKVAGDAGTWYTRDYFDVVQGETAGFTRWVPDLAGAALLVVSEDGEVYRPYGDTTVELSDWERTGTFGRSEWGTSFVDVVRWVR